MPKPRAHKLTRALWVSSSKMVEEFGRMVVDPGKADARLGLFRVGCGIGLPDTPSRPQSSTVRRGSTQFGTETHRMQRLLAEGEMP